MRRSLPKTTRINRDKKRRRAPFQCVPPFVFVENRKIRFISKKGTTIFFLSIKIRHFSTKQGMYNSIKGRTVVGKPPDAGIRLSLKRKGVAFIMATEHRAPVVVCFTGHRNLHATAVTPSRLKQAFYDESEKLILAGARHFISGMALGADICAALAVLELRVKYPEITLECALPCETQAEKWSERTRDLYYSIIEYCDKETLVSKRYSSDCMKKRNRYMVDRSDCVLAFWNGSRSGTGSTVAYALATGRIVYCFDVHDLSVRTLEPEEQEDGQQTLERLSE